MAARTRRRTVLVVEDNPLLATQTCEVVKSLGYDVLPPASTGEEAIRLARESNVDVILMDILLGPGIDGVEAAAIIWELNEVPIVFLTALDDIESINRSTLASPYGYLIKPADPNSIRAALEIVWSRAGPARAARDTNRQITSILASIADAIIAVDDDGNISFVNPAASWWLDLPVGDVIGQPLTTCIELQDADAKNITEALLGDCRNSGRAIALPANARIRCSRGMVATIGAIAPLSPPASGAVLNLRRVGSGEQMLNDAMAIADRVSDPNPS